MPLKYAHNINTWEPVRIGHEGTLTIPEFEQGVFEDLAKLRDMHGVEFITDPWLYLPLTDQQGNPLTLYNNMGKQVERIPGTTYKSAADEFNP